MSVAVMVVIFLGAAWYWFKVFQARRAGRIELSFTKRGPRARHHIKFKQ
jgi:hypothetical protein